MIESLELGNLNNANKALEELQESLGDQKLTPVIVREKLSGNNSFGHPH